MEYCASVLIHIEPCIDERFRLQAIVWGRCCYFHYREQYQCHKTHVHWFRPSQRQRYLTILFPDDVGVYWVTGKEIYERLILAGVDRSLKLAHVTSALKYHNEGATKWRNTNSQVCFRPKRFIYGCNNQLISPTWNVQHTWSLYTRIIENLLKLEEKQKQDAEKKRSEYFNIIDYALSQFTVLRISSSLFNAIHSITSPIHQWRWEMLSPGRAWDILWIPCSQQLDGNAIAKW